MNSQVGEKHLVKRFNDRLRAWGVTSEDTLVLGVSGGKDSMCLLHLAKGLGARLYIAHVNYQLRGDESARDAAFVKRQCAEHGLEFRLLTIDAEDYAREHKLGIQEAARNIRYDWFRELAGSVNASYILTAHHLNDSIESFFINLLRGTSIKGLSGIPARRDQILRPFSDFSSAELDTISDMLGVEFVDDSSNASTRYLRNAVRHNVIPVLRNMSSDFEQRMSGNLRVLNLERETMSRLLRRELARGLSSNQDEVVLQTDLISPDIAVELVLRAWLMPLGYSASQCKDIADPSVNVGAIFNAGGYTLLVDRKQILLRPEILPRAESMTIEIPGRHETSLGTLVSRHIASDSIAFSPDPNIEFVSTGVMNANMELRPWRDGDRFQPLGMSGSQKVHDYLINSKVSRFDKQDVMVLTCDEEIVWIVGFRLSEKFRIESGAKHAIELKWSPND